MKWTAIARHRAGATFVFIFFLVFSSLSLLLAANAVRVYTSISQRSDSTYRRAVVPLYLSRAALRADAEGGIQITTLADGTDALDTVENGTRWRYFCRGGYLYKQAQTAAIGTAEQLCPAGVLRLRQIDGLVRADYTAPDGSRETLLLCARSQGVQP